MPMPLCMQISDSFFPLSLDISSSTGLCDPGVCMKYDPHIGWSCPDCDNVFGLLSCDEQEEISDLYDKIAGKFKTFTITIQF